VKRPAAVLFTLANKSSGIVVLPSSSGLAAWLGLN
jgi:hypothetical protein